MKLNPQIENEINLCVQALRNGGLIIFPGETGWNIGCDVTKKELVQFILADDSLLYPSLLLNDAGKLNKYFRVIPDMLWDLCEFTSRPLDLVLENAINLPEAIISENGETTVRIVKDVFTQTLLHKFGKPVFAAAFAGEQKPSEKISILNTPVQVVNLRLSAGTNTDSLVIIKLAANGRIEFIKQ